MAGGAQPSDDAVHGCRLSKTVGLRTETPNQGGNAVLRVGSNSTGYASVLAHRVTNLELVERLHGLADLMVDDGASGPISNQVSVPMDEQSLFLQGGQTTRVTTRR